MLKVFFKGGYLSLPVVLAFYLFGKVHYKDWSPYIKSTKIDLTTGLRDIDLEQTKQQIIDDAEYVRSKGLLYRIYRFWC